MLKNLILLFKVLLLISYSLSAQSVASENNQTIFYNNNKEVSIQAELFEFDSEAQRQGAVALAKSLRCPQCQNQNLIESNSPVAKDLRLKVFQMVKQGQSNDEIIEFMTYRFGDFVLYDPPFSTQTFVLWLLPLALIVVGVGWAFITVASNRKR